MGDEATTAAAADAAAGAPGTMLRIEAPWGRKRIFWLLLGLAALYLLWLAFYGGVSVPIEQWVPEGTDLDGTIADRAFLDEASAGIDTLVAILLGAVGFCMLLPSLLIGLRREGWDFTPDRSMVAHWWGLGVRWFNRSAGENHFVEIVVTAETRRGDKGRRVDYIVSFGGKQGPAAVGKYPTYREARLAGEQLAKLLQWPMSDDAGPTRIRRMPDQLDDSVRQRAKTLGVVPGRPEAPETLTIVVEESGGSADLRIPAPGLRGARLGRFIASLVGVVAVYLLIVRSFAGGYTARPEDSVRLVTAFNWFLLIGSWAPLLYLLFGIALPTAWTSQIRHRLEVSRDRLRVHRFTPAGSSGVELDAAEIEQIAVGPREGDAQRAHHRRKEVVSVRCDAGFVEFGAGLSGLERQWLRDMLLHYLAR